MFGIDSLLLTALQWAALALGAWALVDALVRPSSAYVAAGKLTKAKWGAIVALATVLLLLTQPLTFLWLPAVIASIVYLVDVRPALRGLRRGNNNSW
jgi:hypothetical protein